MAIGNMCSVKLAALIISNTAYGDWARYEDLSFVSCPMSTSFRTLSRDSWNYTRGAGKIVAIRQRPVRQRLRDSCKKSLWNSHEPDGCVLKRSGLKTNVAPHSSESNPGAGTTSISPGLIKHGQNIVWGLCSSDFRSAMRSSAD